MANSFRFTFAILAATILLSAAMECPAADGKTHLNDGLSAYLEAADFEKAVSELQEAIRLGLDDQDDLIQAYLYVAFAYIGMGQRMPAEAEFEKAIKLNPALSLDPELYSTKTITVFNGTKDRLVDSLTIVSVPGGAEVYLDDAGSDADPAPAGITPLKLSALIGEHTLRVVKEYFQPKVLVIRVEKGRDNRVQVQLDKSQIELRVTSQPPEAAVYVAKDYKGNTPLSVKMILDQELTIKLAKEEFLGKELKVILTETGFSVSGMDDIVPIEDGVGSIQIALKAAPPPGSLRIISDPPEAIIYLDGINMGETPLTIAKITPGTRRIRASMSGFISVTQKVEVVSDKETAVEFALGGQLHIMSIPGGAQVFIDEEYVGLTPFRTGRLPTGSHQLRLAKDQHKERISAAVVERGKQREVNIRLLPVKGSIVVSSDPPGAVVYLDDESKGNTPVFIYGVMVGKHSLKLVKQGYEDQEKQITVEELKVLWQSEKLRIKD